MYASSGSKFVHVVSYPRYVVMWNVIQEQDAVLLYIVFASRQCLACQILAQNEHKLFGSSSSQNCSDCIICSWVLLGSPL